MIPDEPEPSEIDFTWFYFIGRTRFNMTFKEIGRMTVTTFMRFYQHYKNTFDIEMRLSKANTTYAEAEAKAYQQETSWF